MAKFEAIFLERASLALAQHGQDYDIHVAQALVVLAVLAFVGGNFNSGRGHLQAALAAAHALQLATDEDSLDTVLMIHHVERAWSPITGFAHLDLHAFPSLERYTETSMLHEVRLAFTGVQLTARAWTVISSAAYGPRPDASSIIIALDELAPATRSPSARLVISIARFLLQHSVAAWDRSLDAAAGGMAIPTECQQLARMDPVVGWWLAQLNEFLLRTASPHTLSLSREVALAVAHARSMWPWLLSPHMIQKSQTCGIRVVPIGVGALLSTSESWIYRHDSAQGVRSDTGRCISMFGLELAFPEHGTSAPSPSSPPDLSLDGAAWPVGTDIAPDTSGR
ncbi:hypothetical protein AURDEDRAFT_131485 [Auricularia subglabra TFB-10046 SS5]|uniref:Transcription factor domain-containing protein n=1 Tax=Auricularia subglabra (strain TFB-10046 / SS5) TaxID=717982 RepID=J0D4Z5_AURST|nr:hypothetical protein AURDEDRAFT_131485 [Auricularia subglabra TFB-10046 SS5]